MSVNGLYLKLNKAHKILSSGKSMESAYRSVNYRGNMYLLKNALERLFGYKFEGRQKNIEVVKDACSFITVKYNGSEFILTQMAKRQYCRQYGLDIKEWNDSWTRHLSENLKEALSNEGAGKTNCARQVKSEDLAFSLLRDMVIGIKIRVDNYIPDPILQVKELESVVADY